MPAPVVEPRPSLPAARFGAPEEAQEASYFAASARMRSFLASVSSIAGRCRLFVVCSSSVGVSSRAVAPQPWQARAPSPRPAQAPRSAGRRAASVLALPLLQGRLERDLGVEHLRDRAAGLG